MSVEKFRWRKIPPETFIMQQAAVDPHLFKDVGITAADFLICSTNDQLSLDVKEGLVYG